MKPPGTISPSVDDLPPAAAAAVRVAHLVGAIELLADTLEAGLAARIAEYVFAEAGRLGPASPLPLREVMCFGLAFVGRRQRDAQWDWGVLGC